MPAKKEKGKGVATSAAGLSTLFVCLFQYNPMGFELDTIKAFSAAAPILSTATVTFLYWIFLRHDGETIDEMVVNNKVNRSIAFFREQISLSKKDGLDTKKLEESLEKAIIAKTELYK